MTTKSQQDFETAFKVIFPQWIKFERDSLGYQTPSVESGFKLWSASRKQALEDVATILMMWTNSISKGAEIEELLK